jgi:sugar (pentulose or hexulose) kinase
VFLIGIDIGTQGARVVACDVHGEIAAHAEAGFPPTQSNQEGWAEQEPAAWWTAAVDCLQRVTAAISGEVGGVAVTSTSGTVCLLDEAGEPLRSAIMYNDPRAGAEAAEVDRAGAALADKLGYRFAASFALPRLVWLRRHEPALFTRARYLASPTDFIVGWLCGAYGITDYSNALKTGYDLIEDRWPAFIEAELSIPTARLPKVVAPGAHIGTVTARTAAETGLPKGTPVLAGMTDGCASQVSTGAVGPGQWNSTLGTTLVIKGVTRELLRDPEGRVYCHRHPDGYWLPGGASNTGGECIARRFDARQLDALNAAALRCAPTGLLVYPLARTGERFPFARPHAEGFALHLAGSAPLSAGPDQTPAVEEYYTAHLEGVGYVERLAYDVLAGLGGEIGHEIYVAGGANHSEAWLQLRADILQKTLLVPDAGGGAKGAAILAAAGTVYDGIMAAAAAMVRIERRIEPRPALAAAYDERYAAFCAACRERGYL